jgi:LssY C-terminus
MRMTKSRSHLLLSAVVICCFNLPGFAQSNTPSAPAAKDYSYTVSTTQSWTDTKLQLQAGQELTITASTDKSCDPQGVTSAASEGQGLPVPNAAPGALIAKLAAQATPVLVGGSKTIAVDSPGDLFFGVNATGKPPCNGSFKVSVQVQEMSRGDQLKQQLSTAAQIFMQGQFGMGKSANTESPSALKVSTAPLDAGLGKDIDSLPRRVNDQFKNMGDMVNFVLIGSEKQVQDALAAANWHLADTNNTKAVLNAAMATYENKDYLAMPMSTLYLFNRPQDFGYEQAEPIAMVASRNHFRLWKAPFTWKGQEVWAGAGTHDIGFAKDKRNGSVTHKVDPNLDGERTNIGDSLEKAGMVKSMSYYLPSNPVKEAKVATGDSYTSDGRILVVFLK